MKREYVLGVVDGFTIDAERYLARTVHEDYELIDTGVLDQSGNKIMARRRIDPIGFVRFPDKE